MEPVSSISLRLDHIEDGLVLNIESQRSGFIFEVEDAHENNEARYQMVEGLYYDYEFSNDSHYFQKDQIVTPHSRKKHLGTISPNIFVGTLLIPVYKDGLEVGKVELEVQSVKSSYRQDYRDMLELITEKCTDLLLQADSPVTQSFQPNHLLDSQTLYQRFAFINSILNTDEFKEAVHRILAFPVTKWEEISETNKIGKIRRYRSKNIRELITGRNRVTVPDNHFLKLKGFDTVPDKISFTQKTDSIDTPENQFIKHALDVFYKFCLDINKAAKGNGRLYKESLDLVNELETYLQHSLFKGISRPHTLNLNSPVLQRKEGYREILRIWLMFDLAARLIWHGGDDIYRGGKKDVASLYEYWLFFKLLDLFQSIFEIKSGDISDLIKPTKDGLGLQLKQGRHTALKGIYEKGNRKLNIRFSYNRSFSGRISYPSPGSWTTSLRPDYTLTFWPFGISEIEAERLELIVHINFDAKYKVSNPEELINRKASIDNITDTVLRKTDLYDTISFLQDEDWDNLKKILVLNAVGRLSDKDPLEETIILNRELSEEDENLFQEIFHDEATDVIDFITQVFLSEEKNENKRGVYKNADLLKMHAYRDAIRRTGGSYILYPGDKTMKLKGFHEIIPGLGAFPVSPSKTESGILELKAFILEVIDHFINRASQRENIAFKVYDLYKAPPNELKELYPELYGKNRGLIPDETFVLVGYCKDLEHFAWISSKGLYNIRIDERDGSLPVTFRELTAKYILLHTKGQDYTSDLYEIVGDGPKVYSKEKMIEEGYPKENSYLVFRICQTQIKEFEEVKWAFKELPGYNEFGYRGAPFTVTLTQLMSTKI